MKRLPVVLTIAIIAAGAAFAVGYHFRFMIFSQPGIGLGADSSALGLHWVEDVPLEGPASRMDYQAFDAQRGLLLIAHLGGDQVIAYDAKNGSVRGYVAGVSTPHGVTIDPERGRAYVSATGSRQVVAIDEESLQVVGRADGGDFPDGLAFDPGTNLLFVSDESGGGVIVVDTRSMQRVDRIDLGGGVGNTQYDAASRQIIAAAQGRDQLAVIDPPSRTVTAWIDLPGCNGPHGFYVDSPVDAAFVSCEENSALVIVDLAARKVTQAFAVGDVPDVLAFDAGLQRLYVAAESGVVSVFHADGATLSKAGEAYLAPHAHTISVDPGTHSVYVPLEDLGGRPVLRVLQPS